jgi:aspartate/methionine/tyrosine aminotransferase
MPQAVPEFLPFELERWQSEFEHKVEINLADSGVLPLRLRELIYDGDDGDDGDDGAAEAAFGDVLLHYPEVNGNRTLRERIATLHPGADADNVLVTVGGSEANQVIAHTLLQPGDRVVVMRPGYLQLCGIALNLGCEVQPLTLDADAGWRLDPDVVSSSVTPGTRLVSITTPNNPTGTLLAADEVQSVVQACQATNAWLHVDEVYRGSELDGCESASLFGATPRTIVVGSLSKSYALSGLRIGWIVAPHELIADLWRRHEYATISAASVSMYLAEVALTDPVRGRLLERQRNLARGGLNIVRDWVASNAHIVSLVPPRATALAFVRYAAELGSVEVAEALRDQADVLAAPGAYLGAERHLRIAHALAPDRTSDALERIAQVLRKL